VACALGDAGDPRTRERQHLADSDIARDAGGASAAPLRRYLSEILMTAIFVIVQLLAWAGAPCEADGAALPTHFPPSANSDAGSALVIGFMGGFVHPDDFRHSEVQIARHLQLTYGEAVQVHTFENRQRREAHKSILDWLNGEGREKLTAERKRNRRIILYGHSWGASAVVSLARELQRDGIPVLLTIQVDSVAKNGEDDSVIPANVAEAVNFYQPDGILHGRSNIRAADPARTKILGNFRFRYHKAPPECRAYPWYDRFLFKGHTSIECDPRVWSQIDALIRAQLPAGPPPAQTPVTAQVDP
jgi:hypothetical protein